MARLRAVSGYARSELELQRIRQRAFSLLSALGLCNDRVLDAWRKAEQEMGWPAAELIEDEGSYLCSVSLTDYDADEISVTAAPRELIVQARTEGRRQPAHDARPALPGRRQATYRCVEFSQEVRV